MFENVLSFFLGLLLNRNYIENMNIVITGTSQGIGFELVKILSKEHKIFALTSNTSKLMEKIGSNHITIVPFDFRTDLPETIFSDLPHTIDILINNAGTLINKPFGELTPNEIDEIMNVNFKKPILLIQSLIEKIKHSPVRHVVNIGSMGGFQGSSKFPGLSVYSASKAAMSAVTECLAVEYNHLDIRFNCLALGAVQTEMLTKAFPTYAAPLKPQEMAEFIADFALYKWKYFNGKVLPVAVSNP